MNRKAEQNINSREAVALWWITFLQTQAQLQLRPVQRRQLLNELKRELDAVSTTSCDGKYRLYYAPKFGFPAEVVNALGKCQLAEPVLPNTHVMIEFAQDYAHVSVDDTEQLIWRRQTGLRQGR